MSFVGASGLARLMGTVAGGVLFFVGGDTAAYASCNAIPPGAVLYRGAVGSIDRPMVSPDADELLTFRPACGSPAVQDPRFDTDGDGLVTARDLLVSVFFKPTPQRTEAYFIAGNGKCADLEEPMCCLERLFCAPKPRCVTGVEAGLSVQTDTGPGAIQVRLPQSDLAGPVTLAITRAGEPPRELAGKRCADLKGANFLVCIDAIVPAEPGRCDPLGLASAPASTDAGDDAAPCQPAPAPRPLAAPLPFAQLIALPPSNDYREVCSRDLGDLPACRGTADYIKYTVDEAGTVYFPFLWTTILRPKAGTQDLDRRLVRGSTALEAFDAAAGHITIPSAAFLETVSFLGGTFTPVPLFMPEREAESGRPNELTLRGTADKPKSVLRFFRRKVWANVCDGGVDNGQACDPTASGTGDLAECRNGGCGSTTPARYFACAGGARDGLPCTSRHDCPNGNGCRGGSVCYERLGGATTTPCMADTDCPAGQECGRGLFEFRDRVNALGVGTVTRTAGFGESGVCANASAAACSGPLSCGLGFVSCLRYRAEAIVYQ